MERGSTKHGPGLDEAIKKRTEPIERGAPIEPRVEEGRAEEGWSDEDAPRSDNVQLRSDIARYLDRVVYPASRDALLTDAATHNAPVPIIQALRDLPPDRSYENVEEIWEALGGKPERRF